MLNQAIAQIGLVFALSGGLSACAAVQGTQNVSKTDFHPQYLRIETDLLDRDLVDFKVVMRGARTKADVADYAKCAAAQYALIRGYGFARHVRTTVTEKDGLWRGDAVYTVSAALPAGRLTLDAEVVVENCKSDGIPTV